MFTFGTLLLVNLNLFEFVFASRNHKLKHAKKEPESLYHKRYSALPVFLMHKGILINSDNINIKTSQISTQR